MKIQRYMTKGIQENLPIQLQFALWELQMNLRATEKDIDYLQVYHLSTIVKNSKTFQMIHHEAEKPKYSAVYCLESEICIKDKIYIITDHHEDSLVETMLFASEY
ncbi:DUF960 family protein [Anaerotignum sp.]|uniref:DUF960 family protein n=1 Tax=Anaerotignum sp. TaxID=2039241 RepID=UPI00289B0E97|nr:DUF960 family protein [Anaerotignum sp.]